MSGMMDHRAISVLVAILLISCGSSSSSAPTGDVAAGEVLAVEGAVTAERASQPDAEARPLTVGSTIYTDDTIVSVEGASVTIRLFHNEARWSMTGGKRRAVRESASWTAPKAADGELLASAGNDDQTTAAGRHAEREAADTQATAAAEREKLAEPPSDRNKPAPTAPSPPAIPGGKPTKPGGSKGGAGLGISGTGRGGGGTGEGTIGLGHLDTIGRGGGGLGYGSGSGGLGAKRDRKIRIPTQSPTVVGSLPKEVIRRIIRQRTNEIRYCYERERAKDKDLAGKIVMRWEIDAEGGVIKAEVVSNTTASDAVGRCIVGKIKQWAFPAPKGGGTVSVTYPFIFKSPDS